MIRCGERIRDFHRTAKKRGKATMDDARNNTGDGAVSDLEHASAIPILDGAGSQPIRLPAELDAEVGIAKDAERPLDERLEAFENVFESEVGDTHLARARNIERETGMRQLFLKFDGGNPTGTQKDRIALSLIHISEPTRPFTLSRMPSSA